MRNMIQRMSAGENNWERYGMEKSDDMHFKGVGVLKAGGNS